MPEDTYDTVRGLSEGLTQMAGVLLNEQTLDAVLDLVAFLARNSVPAVTGVSVSLQRDGRLVTGAHTDDLAKAIDRAQYETGKGPCVEAARQGRRFRVSDTARESRWPDFASAAADRGMRSSWSLPLAVGGTPIGALNLYSAEPRAFESEPQEALRFAAQAAVILSNAEAYASSELLNDELKDALRTRELIGVAKGILMERESLTDEEAFGMLVNASQHLNVKLRDIAQQIVDSTRDQAEERPSGDNSG